MCVGPACFLVMIPAMLHILSLFHFKKRIRKKKNCLIWKTSVIGSLMSQTHAKTRFLWGLFLKGQLEKRSFAIITPVGSGHGSGSSPSKMLHVSILKPNPNPDLILNPDPAPEWEALSPVRTLIPAEPKRRRPVRVTPH